MIRITSPYAGTPRDPADTGGPYAGDAAAPLTLTGGPDQAVRSYAWRTGDGGTAATRVADHVYARAGTYVAALATGVSAAGGLPSRELARVRVRPVAPVVDAGPDGGTDEGTPYRLTVRWADPEGAGDYTVVVDWGDDTVPDVAVVRVGEPVHVAEHAYCEDGPRVITVEVTDPEGATGRATTGVRVRNVPPRVDAGPACFAYEGVPFDLVATFTDPGWCDTHVADWEFGDGTPARPAIVREEHRPPAGRGTASALHTYRARGTFLATCRVIDDDGGAGRDDRVVRVTGPANPSFEDGFRRTAHGDIGNGWQPYPGAGAGAADLVVLRDGRRAQRLSPGDRPFGIWQQVGANPGWTYEVVAWVSPTRPGGGRLGLDPTGGTDPDGPRVVRTADRGRGGWEPLAVRVRAECDAVTVFLDAAGGEAWFDAVRLAVLPGRR